MRTGVILAGGRSTRFGARDKPLADLAGVPMIRRVANRLAPAVDALVVNCRADQRDAIDAAMAGYDHPVEFAIDPVPDEGPLAGVRTALRATDSEYAAVVACDMPFVDPALVAHLFERASGRDAAVPCPEEWLEPTHAVYRTDVMADACEVALRRGDRKLAAPLDDLDYVTVAPDELADFDPRSFENLNTRAAFDAAANRLK